MSRLNQLKYYLEHKYKSQSAYNIQSPFLYGFAENVLLNKKEYYAFAAIEHIRRELLRDPQILEVEDFGAGSHNKSSNRRSIQSIAKTALIPPAWGAFLFRLVEWGKYRNMLELGTSFGISAAYMAGSSHESKLLTLEGSSAIANIAAKTFKNLGLTNVRQLVGQFEVHLATVCAEKGPFDLVHMDGNHRYQPTIDYFNQLLPFMSEESVVVLDDIHWSKEMHQAWLEISARKELLLTVDLFNKGLVFFHPGLRFKESYCLAL